MPLNVRLIPIRELLCAQRAAHGGELEMRVRHVLAEALPLDRLAFARKRAARERAVRLVVQLRGFFGGDPVLRGGVEVRLDARLAAVDVDAAGAGEAGVQRVDAFGCRSGYGGRAVGNTGKGEYWKKRMSRMTRTGFPSGRVGTW